MPEVRDKRIRAKWEKILFDYQFDQRSPNYEFLSSPDEDWNGDDGKHNLVKKKGKPNSRKQLGSPEEDYHHMSSYAY
jgi:hypothetical protein